MGILLLVIASAWLLFANRRGRFIPVFMVNMALTTVWCLFGVVFYFYGKTFRRWSRNSNVHSLEI